jgi:hypothetical protein
VKYAKAWAAAAGTVVTVLTAALADNVFDLSDTTTLVTTVIEAGATIYAVYKVKNKPAVGTAQK